MLKTQLSDYYTRQPLEDAVDAWTCKVCNRVMVLVPTDRPSKARAFQHALSHEPQLPLPKK